MVLLDLIGTRNPQFLNYFNKTGRLYDHLVYTESRLLSLGSFREYGSSYNKQQRAYFHPLSNPLFYNIRIEDDHIPFLVRKVSGNKSTIRFSNRFFWLYDHSTFDDFEFNWLNLQNYLLIVRRHSKMLISPMKCLLCPLGCLAGILKLGKVRRGTKVD